MINIFHKHDWRFESDDKSSWVAIGDSIICYSAYYKCMKCNAKGHLDAGSRYMSWEHNIEKVKK